MHDIIKSNLINESTMFIMKINLFSCMYPCNIAKYHVALSITIIFLLQIDGSFYQGKL